MQVDSRELATTVVTMYEQFRGRLAAIARARDGEALQTAFRLLIAQRPRIGTRDRRIAAITLANDAVLVTSNRRDFEQIPGLRSEDWTVEQR
jgi:tRNA(fMet)-specific endonuclease VapC